MTTKITKILHKRGLEQNLPILEASEIGFTTDTEKVFIGTDSKNIEIAKQEDVDSKLLDIVGNKSDLLTSQKDNVVSAINEVFQSASDMKEKVTNAITSKGVFANSSFTGDQLASAIASIGNSGLKQYSGSQTVTGTAKLSLTTIPVVPTFLLVRNTTSLSWYVFAKDISTSVMYKLSSSTGNLSLGDTNVISPNNIYLSLDGWSSSASITTWIAYY